MVGDGARSTVSFGITVSKAIDDLYIETASCTATCDSKSKERERQLSSARFSLYQAVNVNYNVFSLNRLNVLPWGMLRKRRYGDFRRIGAVAENNLIGRGKITKYRPGVR